MGSILESFILKLEESKTDQASLRLKLLQIEMFGVFELNFAETAYICYRLIIKKQEIARDRSFFMKYDLIFRIY